MWLSGDYSVGYRGTFYIATSPYNKDRVTLLSYKDYSKNPAYPAFDVTLETPDKQTFLELIESVKFIEMLIRIRNKNTGEFFNLGSLDNLENWKNNKQQRGKDNATS